MSEDNKELSVTGSSLPGDAEIRPEEVKDTAGDSKQEVQSEEVETEKVSQDEPIVVSEEKKEETDEKIEWPNTYRCRTCRSEHPGNLLVKKPIEFRRDESTGEVHEVPTRFTLFCGKCDGYLGITDNFKKSK